MTARQDPSSATGPGRLLPAREAYALWAESYPARPHNPLMEVEQSIVGRLIAAAKPERALDLGSGTGRNVALLQAAGARVIVAVDASLPMLVRAKATGRRVCGDAVALPLRDGQFDFVCSSLMAGDVERIDGWLEEAARTMTARGQLVYSDFHPSWSDAGWRRTFQTATGEEIELALAPHTIADHRAALARCGLTVVGMHESAAPGGMLPIVLVVHAQKLDG